MSLNDWRIWREASQAFLRDQRTRPVEALAIAQIQRYLARELQGRSLNDASQQTV